MEKMLAFVGGAKVVFIIPIPRYVVTGCCKDTEHVSNRLSGELAAEFSGTEKCLLEAAAIGERTGKARLLNILRFFGSRETQPQDLTTVDGASIWAGDGVHLASNTSRVAAKKLMADLARGGEEGKPAAKRSRLESVVPFPAQAKKKVAAKRQPPSSPPRHRRSGSPASCRRPSVGAEPATKTLPKGGEDRHGAARAVATVGPTVDTEGRSRAARAAAGAVGKRRRRN
jgi:hypothetical protein